MEKEDRVGPISLNTECGQILGNERAGCLEFLGVPFAKAERFAYCKRTDHWDGLLDATKYGPGCPQNRAWHEHLEHPTRRFYKKEFRAGAEYRYSEDCLNLNIYTPKNAKGCPVLLFIHGGGFDSGLNAESPFDGDGLARRGVVSVFANYRVGPLGYLCHEEIREEFGRDGNFGMDDQLTALRWVKLHIGDFGGDGENITLMGQSAGAISVQYLCLNKANEGLFRRAVMMSGAGLFPRFALPKNAADTHEYWLDYMKEAGCGSFQDLKTASLDRLFDAMERMHQKRKDNNYNTMPVVDGVLIPEPIDQLIRHPLPVDTMIGFTNNDMYAPVMAFIGKRYAKANGAFVYYFDLDSPGDDNRAFHSCDLRYVFETLHGSWRPYRERDYAVSRELAAYLANFARNGDPNGEGLPVWQKTDKGQGQVLHIRLKGSAMGHVWFGKLLRNMLQKGDPKDEI